MTPISPSTGTKGHISVDRFNAILTEATPLAAYLGIRTERIEVGEAWSRITFSTAALRSGGTYSGPALMALIDVCMYAAVLGAIGEDPRPLTTNIASPSYAGHPRVT
jgi:acyl-coenzyme A thioesterase PaaI-like protein